MEPGQTAKLERWIQRGDEESEDFQGGGGEETALRGQIEEMAGGGYLKRSIIASIDSYPAISMPEPSVIIH